MVSQESLIDEKSSADDEVGSAESVGAPDLGAGEGWKGWARLGAVVAGLVVLSLVGFVGVVGAVVVLLSLVMLHEAGHLWAAKAVGVDVEEFYVGFGPVIWARRTKNGLKTGLKAFPLGGYVKISGMSKSEVVEDESRSYRGVSKWRQIIVAFGGPFANFAIAGLVLMALFTFTGQHRPSLYVGQTVPGMGARAVGILPGDRIVSVDGKHVTSFDQAHALWQGSTTARIGVVRGKQTHYYTIKETKQSGAWLIGIQAADEHVHVSALSAARLSVTSVGRIISAGVGSLAHVGTGVGNLFASFGSGHHAKVVNSQRVMGPVGIVEIGNSAAKSGVVAVAGLVASYSVFLGVFNLLPILPLDGGRILLSMVEGIASAVRGRRVSVPERWQTAMAVVVVAVLLGLGLVAMAADILHPVANPF